MTIRNRLFMLFAVLGVWSAVTTASAEEVCKWVDENGTVHYDTTCPESVEADTLEVNVEDPVPEETDPYAATRERMAAQSKTQASAAASTHGAAGKQDYSKMSAAQLSAECERQRTARLAPEREKLIAECKAAGDKSASHCERFYADWGDGGQRGGHTVPRRYDDLPVCIAARERNG